MKSRDSAVSDVSTRQVDEWILEGLSAHKAGRLAQAAEYYDRALRLRPDHPDALNLSGACAFAAGKFDLAIRSMSKAVRLLPSHIDAYLNLSEALSAAGRRDEAIETCVKALRFEPDRAEFHARLAGLLATTDERLAIAHARVALALEPDCVEALRAKGHALRRQQKFIEAEAAFARAVELAPEDVPSIMSHAGLLVESDRGAEAEKLFRRAATLRPNDAKIMTALANAIERNGDASAALAFHERATALDPTSADARYWRACALRDLGDFAAAETEFRNILKATPNHAPVMLALVRMKRLGLDEASEKQLARLAADPAQPGPYRAQANFALGDMLDKAGNTDAAFRRYAEANKVQAKVHADASERHDPAALREIVRAAETRVAREYAEDTGGWGVDSELPVFVVGLTRSGTTLVEQICASHSQVVGAGELGAVVNAARAIAAHNDGRERIADWDRDFSRARARSHLDNLTRRAQSALRVVDKTPLNLMRLGLIGAMYPGARVLRLHRDPRDVAFSNHICYFGSGNLWSTDLKHCGDAVLQIDRLGDIWARHSKLRILDIVYEDLVADLETQTRKIIAFLGLDWEPGCHDFHKTNRRVDTPSSWQVRQPVYSSSVRRWRRYEKHLGPMFEALGLNRDGQIP